MLGLPRSSACLNFYTYMWGCVWQPKLNEHDDDDDDEPGTLEPCRGLIVISSVAPWNSIVGHSVIYCITTSFNVVFVPRLSAAMELTVSYVQQYNTIKHL